MSASTPQLTYLLVKMDEDMGGSTFYRYEETYSLLFFKRSKSTDEEADEEVEQCCKGRGERNR